jgi:pimeloyl-ACP methyl ester carboxylesterase
MKNTPPLYEKGTVLSKDGTVIGYRKLGRGPGLILVHGGLKSSQDFMKLAQMLSDSFTVYVVDRRGRGFSGAYGSDDDVVMCEAEDIRALAAETKTHNIFALSSGALATLKAALITPSLKNIALYEPPLSINGSVPTAWVARYESDLAQAKVASALVEGMKGLRVVPVFAILPRWLSLPLLGLVMRLQGKSTAEEVTIRSLVPTWHYDMIIVDEMKDSLNNYAALSAHFLLLGGTKSPAFLATALGHLSEILPHVERVTYPGLGHDGPEDDGRPELVAKDLQRFFN